MGMIKLLVLVKPVFQKNTFVLPLRHQDTKDKYISISLCLGVLVAMKKALP
jgi:hypothetical protein